MSTDGAEATQEAEGPTHARLSRSRSILFAAVSSVLFLVLIEGVLSWAYAFSTAWEESAPIRPEKAHAQHDPDLGWSHIPSLHVANLYGPGQHFTSNSLGHRALEEYPVAVPEDRKRVLFVGDSFTMGVGVGDEGTFPARIEARDPRIQSVNMGMGAYGVDQAYLAYERDGEEIEADAVVLSFIEHDFARMNTDFYMAPKPQLRLDGDTLVVTNRPVPEADLGERLRQAGRQFTLALDLGKVLRLVIDRLPSAEVEPATRSYRPAAERMFSTLQGLATGRGHALLLVYLPTLEDLEHQLEAREWLRAWSDSQGVSFTDLTPWFRQVEPARRHELFLPDRHYSVAGNDLVAQALHMALLPALHLESP